MGTLVTLDDYAQDALREYTRAVEDIREASARKDKARDAIITFLRLNDGDTGEVAGKPVIRLISADRTTIDTARLKVEEPFVYRRFARISSVDYLRTVEA